MLTIEEGLQIAQESARRIRQTSAHEQRNVHDITLEDYGLDSAVEFDLLRRHIDSLVRERAHSINPSHLTLVTPSSRITDLAQLISRFSLPGDEGFGEPLAGDESFDPPTMGGGGDEGFDEP